MSENERTDAAAEADGKAVETHSAQDSLLVVLSLLALNGTSIPVTLSVGGMLVCGETISGKEYFQATIDLFHGATNDESTKDLFEGALRGFMEPYEEPSQLKIGYIHLKNVRYHTPSNQEGIPNGDTPQPMWRGRLSQIDGFHFGRFSRR